MSKIKVKNDWDYLTYTFEGEPIDEKKGGKVWIRFPDGSEQTCKYVSQEKRHQTFDMGHTYEGTHYDLIAKVKVHGTFLYIPLQNLPNVLKVIQEKSPPKEKFPPKEERRVRRPPRKMAVR